MPKMRCQHNISLDEELEKKVRELQKKGYSVINIFRKGIEELQKK